MQVLTFVTFNSVFTLAISAIAMASVLCLCVMPAIKS
jgi:hypothetical protein